MATFMALTATVFATATATFATPSRKPIQPLKTEDPQIKVLTAGKKEKWTIEEHLTLAMIAIHKDNPKLAIRGLGWLKIIATQKKLSIHWNAYNVLFMLYDPRGCHKGRSYAEPHHPVSIALAAPFLDIT
ncbi:hypothetical protein F5Y18DRAFT_430082 [Xylariaceae sp. FL1019]|nr:hypothetical protein F5Y18DRAFT_430082 [Xylariaceae sp. FL1019]